jgi:uncharacterized protein
MKTVHLARGLTFPAAELSTLVVGLLGNRGSGKSNTAFCIIEGQLDAGIPVVVLDYVGIYWSLRLDEDGKHASRFHLPVLGGPHGDITLVPSTGAIVAEALAKGQSSAVLDVSSMSKGDRCRFATDFAEAFFNAKKSHPGPVQLWLEESQRFIPQKLFHGQERMLGAFEEIAEVGRNYGIGLGLISQRPQKIAKDVLNLADVLIAFRMNGVLERKAIGEWVQEKDTEGREAVKDELPGLERGEAIVWSPSVFNVYGRYKLGKRTTYDVNATPLSVRKTVKIKALDLEELETAMGAAVEQAKANDPRVLKTRIAELERELAKKPEAMSTAKTTTVEKSVLKDKDIARLEKLCARLEDGQATFLLMAREQLDRLAQRQQPVVSELGNLRTLIGKAHETKLSAESRRLLHDGLADTRIAPVGPLNRVLDRPRQVRAVDRGESGDITKCARALLRVLAVRGTASDSQISALSGYKKTSSSFSNGLSELRTRGFIDGSPDGRVITAQGKEAAGPQEPLPTGAALVPYWMGRLTKAEATMLRVIYDAGTISREDLAERADYSITSSSFGNALSGLRTLDLIHGRPGGDVTIADVFRE